MMLQRLSRIVSKWHQPTPSALVAVSHQAPWTHVYPVCLSIVWSENLSQIFLAPYLPPRLWCLRFLTDYLASKGWCEKDIQYLSLFHAMCHQIPHLIQPWSHIFPSLPFAYVFIDTLPLFLTSLTSISPRWTSAFLFLCMLEQYICIPPSLPVPDSIHCLFLSEFGQELLVHPYRSPGIFAYFLAWTVLKN